MTFEDIICSMLHIMQYYWRVAVLLVRGCLSYFAMAWHNIQYLQFKGGGVYLGVQFQPTVHQLQSRNCLTKGPGWKTAAHPMTSRNQRMERGTGDTFKSHLQWPNSSDMIPSPNYIFSSEIFSGLTSWWDYHLHDPIIFKTSFLWTLKPLWGTF